MNSIQLFVQNFINSTHAKLLWKASKMYLFWILLHWIAVQLYQYMCTPATFWGLLFGTAVATQMPHCKAALWVINHSSTIIRDMWLLLGGWMISQVVTNQE